MQILEILKECSKAKKRNKICKGCKGRNKTLIICIGHVYIENPTETIDKLLEIRNFYGDDHEIYRMKP